MKQDQSTIEVSVQEAIQVGSTKRGCYENDGVKPANIDRIE